MPKAQQLFDLYRDLIKDDFKIVIRVNQYGEKPMTAYGKWFDAHIQHFMDCPCEGFEISVLYRWAKFYVNTYLQSKN